MTTRLEARIAALEARRSRHRAGFASRWTIDAGETVDEAIARAAAQGVASICLLLPRGFDQTDEGIAAWSREADEHNARESQNRKER